MIYVLIAISALFVALAFIVTEKNAKHLLSGYNTMSIEERKHVDIKGLMVYFKNFFLLLGISFLLISLLLLFYFGQNIAAIFICIYPVVACIYFVLNGQKFYHRKAKTKF
jgi:hypothetical protein